MNDVRLDLGEYIFISSLCKPVADPGIDRRGGGADFFLQEFMITTAGKANLLYPLEGPGGLLSRKILKSTASNEAFIGRNLFFNP